MPLGKEVSSAEAAPYAEGHFQGGLSSEPAVSEGVIQQLGDEGTPASVSQVKQTEVTVLALPLAS